MTRRTFVSLIGLGSWAIARRADAHHSTAMFDLTNRITLTGSIKEFQWTNPHAWIQVVSAGPDGANGEWSIECGSPNTLSRQGWRASTLRFGDKVTIVGNSNKGNVRRANFAKKRLKIGKSFTS